MTRSSQVWTEKRIEILVSHLLRIGVILAGVIVLIGGVLYLMDNGGELPQEHVFRGEPAALRQIPGIVTNAFQLNGQAIIQLGVLLLILTPIARVAFSVFAFWQQHDRLYVFVTLVIFAILVHGLFATG